MYTSGRRGECFGLFPSEFRPVSHPRPSLSRINSKKLTEWPCLLFSESIIFNVKSLESARLQEVLVEGAEVVVDVIVELLEGLGILFLALLRVSELHARETIEDLL